MATFIICKKRFKSYFEAQASVYCGTHGSINNRRVNNIEYLSLDDAITAAQEMCAKNFEHKDLVIYKKEPTMYYMEFRHTNVADIYWDIYNNLVGTVTYPLAIAA